MSVVAGAANLKRRTVLVLEPCRPVGVPRAANRWPQQRFPARGTQDEMDVELREGLRHAYLTNAPSGLLSPLCGIGLSTQAAGLGWDKAPLWGSNSPTLRAEM